MALIETVVYIPVSDNDSVPFTQADWSALYVRLAQITDGATRRGPHQGTCTAADGVLYIEPVCEFEVAIHSWFDLPVCLEVVRWAQGHFRQRAIHFKVAGIHENYPAWQAGAMSITIGQKGLEDVDVHLCR